MSTTVLELTDLRTYLVSQPHCRGCFRLHPHRPACPPRPSQAPIHLHHNVGDFGIRCSLCSQHARWSAMLALAKSRETFTEQRVEGDAGMGGESVGSSSLYLSNTTPTHEGLPLDNLKETLILLGDSRLLVGRCHSILCKKPSHTLLYGRFPVSLPSCTNSAFLFNLWPLLVASSGSVSKVEASSVMSLILAQIFNLARRPALRPEALSCKQAHLTDIASC